MWGFGRKANDANIERSLVWIVGSPRSGSTWLLNLLRASPAVGVLDEPLIGAHLGLSAAATLGVTAADATRREDWRALDAHHSRDDYFFSDRYRAVWAPALRTLLLARLGSQLSESSSHTRLVIKEPHGSEAADLLAALLPRSRFLFLVRDGRDVVDSLLDALSGGGWATDLAVVDDGSARRLSFLVDAAHAWVQRMSSATRAFDGHPAELGLLVRYEELLSDTQPQLERVLTWAGLPVPAGLAEHVEKLSFAQVRESDKGAGRFHRAATPGLWRTNLSDAEQVAVEDVMAPVLRRLGYEVGGV